MVDEIIKIGEINDGYITSREVNARGIPTVYLSRMVTDRIINKLSYGIYILNGYPEDEIYTAALRYNRAVFSRRTALYLNGITNRQFECIEANFPAKYNTSKVQGMKCYKPCDELYELGKVLAVTPLGHAVKSYSIERCICDLFYYDDFDIEDKSYAIKAIDKNKINYDKLFSYAKIMRVLPQVKSVFEVISWT